jgi:hypothetical protein
MVEWSPISQLWFQPSRKQRRFGVSDIRMTSETMESSKDLMLVLSIEYRVSSIEYEYPLRRPCLDKANMHM